ncbi:MAG: GAF domain-containing protein [Mycobacterium sp.]|nr:GAF domain-containing protein [Mycobacterium sp.]
MELLPAVDHAGATLIRRKIGTTSHDPRLTMELNSSTGPVPKIVNDLQIGVGEGPFYDAIWDHETVRVPDVTTERRWPTLMAGIAESTPVRSLLSIQLYISGKQLGALNLLSNTAGAFDADTEAFAVNLATHTAIGLSGAQRGEQLYSALASRTSSARPRACSWNASTSARGAPRLARETFPGIQHPAHRPGHPTRRHRSSRRTAPSGAGGSHEQTDVQSFLS